MPFKSKSSFLVRACALVMCAASFTPAHAQFFWQSPDFSAPSMTGAEADIGVNLPGATPEELQAGMLWQLRAALNVAALQCDFEPTLMTTTNYNSLIAHHDDELAKAFKTVGSYFTRTKGNVAGQKELDQYGTRTYSSFSTVQAQRGFCQVAGSVGRDALFAPRGSLHLVAEKRLGEIKKSLKLAQDQYFNAPGYEYTPKLPPLNKECWKKGALVKKCAALWPPKAS